MDLSQHLTAQPKDMDRLVDGESGAILFRHPTLRGLPDLVVEGYGYTLEFIGPTLLCLDIQDPSGIHALMQLPADNALAEQIDPNRQIQQPLAIWTGLKKRLRALRVRALSWA